ncbi:MAG TPA: hypothetical protein VFQ86_07675, partial [Arachidicoccus soli]|nr:hypothetical protein [Arachidicoccus soli]
YVEMNQGYVFEIYRQEFGLPILKLVDIEKYNYIKKLKNKIEQLDHCRYIWGQSTRIRGSDLEKPFMPMCVGCERRR